MPYTLSIIKVKDYAKWESDFNGEEGAAMRKASGMKSWHAFRTDDEPDSVALLMEWDNLDDAQKFTQSPKLREVMQQSGVIGHVGYYPV
jgi:heme-degrading monooxygenase HmoA